MALEFDPRSKPALATAGELPKVQNDPTLTDLKIVHEENTDWDIKVATHPSTQQPHREAIVSQLIKRGKNDAAEKIVNTLFSNGHAVAAELLAKIKKQ